VAYSLKVRTVETEKQPLPGDGCVPRNNGVTIRSGVFCTLRAEEQLPLRESYETAVKE
jgi:hypothetical protein